MRTPRADLFTTNYAVMYGGWVQTDLPVEGQFRTTYLWCNYYVYTWTSNFNLLVRVEDKNGKLVYEGYIKTITDFKNLEKKLNMRCNPSKCTEKDVEYWVDENENYFVDENNIYLIV